MDGVKWDSRFHALIPSPDWSVIIEIDLSIRINQHISMRIVWMYWMYNIGIYAKHGHQVKKCSA